MTDDRTTMLRIGMDALVPIWIGEVVHWPAAERQRVADQAADLISCGADQIWQPDRRKRDLPRGAVVTALAQGLAVLAHAQGGVDWVGGHWCAAPHRGCPRLRRAGAVTPS